MATKIEQQVVLDEALVPSTKRLRIGRSNFRVPSDIQSKESTLQVVYDVLRRCPFFKAFLVTADVPEIYMQEFWATAYVHQYSIRFKMDSKKNIVDLETFRDMLHICLRVSSQSFDELPFEEEILDFIRDDILFSTIKVVSRHQNTQQYGAMLPIELTNEDIRNTKAYKEYYACATGEAAPKPKKSARRKKSGSDTSITPPTAITTPTTTLGGSSTDEGTDVDAQDKNRYDDEGDKKDESDDEEIESDEESNEEETREEEEEEESFDPIPRTPEDSEDDGNGEKDQGLRVSKEQRLIKEEEADELYRDVDINQGRGLQLSQDIKDSHVTLTLVNPDGQQESSSVPSHFVSSMLNLTSDAGMESIFATASSLIAPLQTPTPIMTPSTIATITTISHPPIPPTLIPSDVLQHLPTFDSVFYFEDRLKSLEINFLKFIQTNQFVEAVSNILAILKRRREDDDDQEGPFAGSDRGSKRRREGGEPESAHASLELVTRSVGRSTTGFKSRQASASESAFAEGPVQTTSQIEEPSHPVFKTGAEDQPIVQTS
nr:hypothetical protein [Tanacetum cinerariifolium]